MLFHRLSGTLPLSMTLVELLGAFVQVPELSSVGSAQDRAAFIAVRIEVRTVRDVGRAIGVSKSQIPNLVDRFQEKLAARMMELTFSSFFTLQICTRPKTKRAPRFLGAPFVFLAV